MDSLCHPWFTTTKLSYRFPILKLPPPPCAVLIHHNQSPTNIYILQWYIIYIYHDCYFRKPPGRSHIFAWLPLKYSTRSPAWKLGPRSWAPHGRGIPLFTAADFHGSSSPKKRIKQVCYNSTILLLITILFDPQLRCSGFDSWVLTPQSLVSIPGSIPQPCLCSDAIRRDLHLWSVSLSDDVFTVMLCHEPWFMVHKTMQSIHLNRFWYLSIYILYRSAYCENIWKYRVVQTYSTNT